MAYSPEQLRDAAQRAYDTGKAMPAFLLYHTPRHDRPPLCCLVGAAALELKTTIVDSMDEALDELCITPDTHDGLVAGFDGLAPSIGRSDEYYHAYNIAAEFRREILTRRTQCQNQNQPTAAPQPNPAT